MKYKKLHELSGAEYQVLRNIAARNLFDLMDVQLVYIRWSRGEEVNEAIEKEFEMAFLDANTNYVTKNDLSKGIQMSKESFITCNISKSLQNTPKVLSKPKRDLIINADDIMNLRIELNRADISFNNFLERV